MEKLEIFNYILTTPDKSGWLKKEETIKKKYPELYEELKKIDFPTHFTFVQKLWHFLQDDYEIHKCKCGNELHFIDFKKGYRTYCSRDCPYVIEYNKTTLPMAQLVSRNEKSRKKAVQTILDKNGGKFWSDENIQKLKDRYNQNREYICEKMRNWIKSYQEEQNKRLKEKIKENIRQFNELSHKTVKGCVSTVEIQFYEYLIDLLGFDKVEPQYYNKDIYPFSCDFYLPDYDLYIEIQGHWTHGGHPYNENNSDDVNKLSYWKSKNNRYYNNAIYTWTDLDVRKRKIAQKNNLNYLEIFSHHLDECITKFEDFIKLND
jgi:hypothetical protein